MTSQIKQIRKRKAAKKSTVLRKVVRHTTSSNESNAKTIDELKELLFDSILESDSEFSDTGHTEFDELGLNEDEINDLFGEALNDSEEIWN